ncbi:unnamed protein product [Caenorhabditis bovis]|uniref:Glutathione peroxidase n=1 Tax=Caenorhabditis bovis TaxID=2654633 RepID=A0A8S1EVT9_9PELO|nr:unnamed protein product [Caenorhabditis bovis]
MATPSSIYDFQVKHIDGSTVSLDKYSGLVVIIVNVASYCGLTNSNYNELKELQEKYYDRGLRVAAFPCNQFAFQEPFCEADISKFVTEKFKFEPDLYAKINVNGANADPLWNYLKSEQGGTLFDAIKWNFTKFLVNRKGKVVARFGPNSNPKSFENEIIRLLDESA